MVLDANLLNTQHYKVRIKGKMEQSSEWSSALLYICVVAIVKGAFGLPSTAVTNVFFLQQQLTKNSVHNKQFTINI